MMTRVLVFHPEGERYRALVAARAPGVAVECARDPLQLRQRIPAADVLLTFQFPLDILRAAQRLRWIQVTSAGTEFLMPAAPLLGPVLVTNARGLHAAPIADYVMTAAVMLHSDFPRFFRAQSARRWDRRPVQALAGKALGVVGLGSIGQEIARRAVAAGMEVLGVRRSGAAVAGVSTVFPPSELPSFLGACDFVVVTVPMTGETQALIGREELAHMKASAYLINVARGPVVDQRALSQALREGRLAGACLDVFETEPLPPDDPLWSMSNVIVTPHIAGMRVDYAERLAELFVENVRRFQAGRELLNRVDVARGY